MCYAIPGKVTALDGNRVTVDYYGETKQALNEFKEVVIGDYIYAQGGYVVEKIPEAEAFSILSAWKEIFFDLQDLDQQISSVPPSVKTKDNPISKIIDKASEEKILSPLEMEQLLNIQDSANLELMYKTANFLRHKHLSNSCCVHGIIEISNYCIQSCTYCGISNQIQSIKRYRMTKGEILQSVDTAVKTYGFKALVLQSGEGAGYDIEELVDIVREIKAKYAVLLFISFGEVGIAGLQKLFAAGARGLLMRFETANPKLYGALHPGCVLEDRLVHLRAAYKMGYLILTGGLIGLPGQTAADIVQDVLLAKELNAEMFSFGPFIPHPESQLAQDPAPTEEQIIKVLALARYVDPVQAKILVTTGLETISALARKKALLAGANSVMLNVTPLEYRKLYSIYPNRAHENESIENQIAETLELLKSIGRAPTDLGI